MTAPRALADHEYDAEGWPTFPIDLSWRAYSLALGLQTCWLAQFADLPGYYGEGATIGDALIRLRTSLGPRPHYQVTHKIRTPKKLESDIRRKYKALAVAAVTYGGAWDYGLGAGAALDETAKELGVGKEAVNLARKELQERLTPPPGQFIAGVTKTALATIARPAQRGDQSYEGSAFDTLEMNIWLVKETPWRLEHEEAQNLFPKENG